MKHDESFCLTVAFKCPLEQDAGVQLGFWELLEYIVMEVSFQTLAAVIFEMSSC
jgi:hypothetical protein